MNTTVMEKRSLHFSILFTTDYEKYAHIALQIAEEEYMRISGYILKQMNKPLTIQLVVPDNEYPSGYTIPDTDFLIQIPIQTDYAILRREIAQQLAGALLYQSVVYSSEGKALLFPELVHHKNPLVRGYQSYIARGSDDLDRYRILEYVYHERTFRLSPLVNEQTLLRYRGFYYFLEKKYGRNECARFISLLLNGRGRGYASSSIFSSSYPGLLKKCSSWYREHYSSARYMKGSDISIYKDRNILMTINNSVLTVKIGSKRTRYTITRGTSGGPVSERSVYVSPEHGVCLYAGKDSEGTFIDRISLNTAKSKGKIHFPFYSITTPSLTPDGKRILFAGHTATSCDLYEYSLSEKELVRLTDDLYTEQDPVCSPDGRYIAYASNYSSNGDFDSSHRVIRELDRITREQRTLAVSGKYSIHPCYSAEGTSLSYTSISEGSVIPCKVDRLTGAVVADRSTGGMAFPYSDRGKIRFIRYSGSDDNFSVVPEDKLRYVPAVRADISEFLPERAALIDYSKVEVSTYRRGGWNARTTVDGVLFPGDYAGAQIATQVYDTKGKSVFSLSIDHMYGYRSPEDIGLTLSYERAFSQIAGFGEFTSLYPHSMNQPTLLLQDSGTAPVNTYTTGFRYSLPLPVNIGGGISYTEYTSEDRAAERDYLSPFLSLNLGTKTTGLLSDGNWLSIKGSLVDTAAVLESGFGLYQTLFPRFLYTVEGEISYIADGGDDELYIPAGGNYLRGFPRGYGKGLSLFENSHSVYYIPYYNIGLGSLHTGPVGIGLFYDWGYIVEAENSRWEGYEDDLGMTLRMGLPEKYYLKLDCVIPVFYGYSDTLLFLCTAGITF